MLAFGRMLARHGDCRTADDSQGSCGKEQGVVVNGYIWRQTKVKLKQTAAQALLQVNGTCMFDDSRLHLAY